MSAPGSASGPRAEHHHQRHPRCCLHDTHSAAGQALGAHAALLVSQHPSALTPLHLMPTRAGEDSTYTEVVWVSLKSARGQRWDWAPLICTRTSGCGPNPCVPADAIAAARSLHDETVSPPPEAATSASSATLCHSGTSSRVAVSSAGVCRGVGEQRGGDIGSQT
jgi:hypothetical protein